MDFSPMLAPLGVTARNLWESIHADYDLSASENLLLLEICRTVDRLDALNADIQEHGMLSGGKLRPAAREARQLGIVFARLMGALSLPDLDTEEDAPPKYVRTGTRGPYKLVSGNG